MAMGRPPKYKPEYCEQLVEHMKGGLSYESFAAIVGVCRDTLYQWEKDYPDFSDAKKQGVVHNMLFWERVGRAAVLGTKGPDGRMVPMKNFNSAVWIFNMKNRHGWRDKQELSGSLAIEPFVVESPSGETTTIGGKQK